MINITPDQLASAGGYIAREWGDHGYRIYAVESPTHAVSVFRVSAWDGSRFTVTVDKWGNVRHLDTHNSDDGLAELVTEMHVQAVAP